MIKLFVSFAIGLGILLLSSGISSAAAPASHVVVALELIEKGKIDIPNKDIPAFIRGTSFNDIRYLGVINRTQTHTNDVTWEMVQHEKDPFKKGMLLHSLLDVAREKYMVENKIYNSLPESAYPFQSHIVKFVEDELVYDFISNWNFVQDVFQVIDEGEQEFQIPDNAIYRWHQLLTTYLSEKPTSAKVLLLLEKLKGTNPNYEKLVPIMESLKTNEDFQSRILTFYNNVDSYLEEYHS